MQPPTDRRRALRHAEALVRQGERREAIERYTWLLREAPDDWSTAHVTADLLQLADRHGEALTIYLGMARYWARAGEPARAIEVYQRVLRLAPGNRTALVRLAELAMAGGDDARARSLLSELLPGADPGGAILPGAEAAAAAAGDPLRYLQAGRIEEARTALVRTAVHERGVSPPLAEAWREAARAGTDGGAALAVALADVCLLAGDASEAIATLRGFLDEVPGHVEVLHHLLEVTVETGAGVEALQAQSELVDAYLELGMPDRAVPVAEDLASRYPDPDNTARLSRLRGLAEPQAPEGLGLPGVPGGPGPAGPAAPPREPVRDLSDALDGLGQPAAADDARSVCARGVELERAGRLEEAEALLRRAAKSPGERCAAAWALSRTFRRTGRTGEAIEWLEHAAEAAPPTPEVGRAVLLDLAGLLEAEGEHRRALAVLVALQAGDDPPGDVADRIRRLNRPHRSP